jgi:hypothetical protein
MRPSLTAEMAQVVIDDRVEAAERFRRRQQARGRAVALRAAERHDEGSNSRRRSLRERLGLTAERLSGHGYS